MNILYLSCLLILGLIAIIVEFFVPAAGIIGIIGGSSIVTSVVLAFRNYGILTGSIFLITAFVLTPLIIILYFRVFPKTIIGKKLILGKNQSNESENTGITQKNYRDLTGTSGKVLKDLRPTGIIEIDGRKLNALTNGEYLGAGSSIKVFKVEGNRIFVKKAIHPQEGKK